MDRDDIEMMFQGLIEQALNDGADPEALASYFQDIAETIRADIEAGAYEE